MSEIAREVVLDSIRTATGSAASIEPLTELAALHAALPRGYIRKATLAPEAILALLTERLREYDAQAADCSRDQLPSAVAEAFLASNRSSFLIPPSLPADWLDVARIHPQLTLISDHNLSTDEVEDADGVITAASCAIADSGTIVLHHSPAEGRRLITLLPDWHLCILRASQVVQTLPEYFDRCPNPPRLVTWISGPSATADIEMTRIKGVHGPRFLHVLLVRDDQ